MIPALASLLIFQALGELLVHVFGLPLPGALVGMLLLFVCLVLHGRTPDALTQTTGTLLQHMMLLFIPAVAGVMVHFERIASEWLPFVIACIVGAMVTLAVTALALNWMLKLKSQGKS